MTSNRDRTRNLALAAILTCVSGCTSNPVSADFEGVCPQTFEFGNFGCARVVLEVDRPTELPPAKVLWVTSARPADSLRTLDRPRVRGPFDDLVVVHFTRWQLPPPDAPDTISVWITTAMHDDTGPIQSNTPRPIFAADSILHRVRFYPVGTVPEADTLRLELMPR